MAHPPVRALLFLLATVATPALAIPGGGPCRAEHGTWAPYTMEHTGVPLRLSAWWALSLPEPVDGGAGLFVAREFVSDLGWVEPAKPVRLTLADGSTVELVPTERIQARREGLDVSQWAVPVTVTPAQVQALSASPITKAELPVGDKTYAIDVKAGKGKKAQAGARCLVGG
jgi:hypothetical protein